MTFGSEIQRQQEDEDAHDEHALRIGQDLPIEKAVSVRCVCGGGLL